jgi:hypothetical protein
MKNNAIKFVREHTEDGQNMALQTKNRYYYINEAEGDQWKLIEDCDLLAIYKGDETHYIDTAAVESFEIIKGE